MTAVDEQTYYNKLQAIRDIKGRTIQLDKLKNRIYREIENTDAEEKSLAEYRREMELLLQEKMSHVEELRQIHADINAMETVIKQAEENRARSLNVANKVHEEYVPLKNEIDHMRHEYLGLSPIPDLHEEEGGIMTAEYSTILQKLLDLRLKQTNQAAHFNRFQAAASSFYHHQHQQQQQQQQQQQHGQHPAGVGGKPTLGGPPGGGGHPSAASAASGGSGGSINTASFARPPLTVNSGGPAAAAAAAAAAGAHHSIMQPDGQGPGAGSNVQPSGGPTGAGPSSSGGFLAPPPSLAALRMNKPPEMGQPPQRMQQQPSIGMAHPTFSRQQPPPMKSCLSCHQQIHRNAPICPLCKAKSRSRNPKKPKKKDH